jgi:hypothetical protein
MNAAQVFTVGPTVDCCRGPYGRVHLLQLAQINVRRSLDLQTLQFRSQLHRLDALLVPSFDSHPVLIVKSISKVFQERRDRNRVGETQEMCIAPSLSGATP